MVYPDIHLDINICVLCAEYGYQYSLDGEWHTNFVYLEVKDGKGSYGMKDKRDNRKVVVSEYFVDGLGQINIWMVHLNLHLFLLENLI